MQAFDREPDVHRLNCPLLPRRRARSNELRSRCEAPESIFFMRNC